MKRVVLLAVVAALSCLGLASPVLAASPGNDTYGGRTVIDSLPFNDALDTSEATTDATDVAIVRDCGAPATDASVWYQYTPSVDGGIAVDASDSDYAVGIVVVAGTPDEYAFLGCAAGSLGVPSTAGETLTILIFDYDGVGNGGNLSVTVTEVPPPPILEVTIAPRGSVNQRTGVATITGTITCSGGDESAKTYLEVRLTQTVGRFTIDAGGATSFTCNGLTEPWVVEVAGSNGRLGGGKATVSIFAFACTFECGSVEAQQTVTLRR